MLGMPISGVPFAVLDTETTTFSKEARVHQIGIATLLNGEVLDNKFSYHLNIFDGNEPDEDVLDDHYDYDHLYDCIHFSDVVERMERYCHGKVIVAHNESYDRKKLLFEYDLINRVPPEQFTTKYIDTKKAAQITLADELNEDRSLDNIADILNRFMLDENDRHEALPDAILTAELLGDMLEIFSEDGSKLLVDLIETLGIKYS